MEKIIKNFKENKLYYMTLFVGLCLLLFQMSHVVMYADDFSLSLISAGGMKAIISNQINHYFTWGGGFTPILVTTFLLGRFYYWKIFISLLLVLIIMLSVNMLKIKEDKNRALVAGLFYCFLFLTTIYILRETVFWLDGSMAYVFTAFQVYLYFYFLVTRVLDNINKKYDVVLFPIVAFFAGWSSAQTGAVALFLPIIILFITFIIKNKKINKLSIICSVLSIIGFCIFYFAPGNGARMEYWELYNGLGFFDKILYRVDNVYSLLFDFQNRQYFSIIFYILLFTSLLITLGIKQLKRKNNKLLKYSLVYMLIILISYVYIYFELPQCNTIYNLLFNYESLLDITITLPILLPYIFSSLFMIAIVISAYIICDSLKISSVFYACLGFFISHGVMVMAPYSEYRTEFLSIIFIWFAIISLLFLIIQKKYEFNYVIVIPFVLISKYFLMFMLILYLLFKTFELKEINKYKILILILLTLSLLNYINIYRNYKVNEVIYDKNISILKNYNKTDETIYLYSPNDELYGFGSFVGTSYVEEALKIKYNIDGSVIFMIKSD